MPESAPFVLPTGLTLTHGDDGFSIEYAGDVTLPAAPGFPVGTIRSGGDVTVVDATVGRIEAEGAVVLQGQVKVHSVVARSIAVPSGKLKVKVLQASEDIELSAARVEADVVVGATVRIDGSVKGRATAISSGNALGPHQLKGGFSLQEFVDLVPNGAEMLESYGIEVPEEVEEIEDDGPTSEPEVEPELDSAATSDVESAGDEPVRTEELEAPTEDEEDTGVAAAPFLEDDAAISAEEATMNEEADADEEETAVQAQPEMEPSYEAIPAIVIEDDEDLESLEAVAEEIEVADDLPARALDPIEDPAEEDAAEEDPAEEDPAEEDAVEESLPTRAEDPLPAADLEAALQAMDSPPEEVASNIPPEWEEAAETIRNALGEIRMAYDADAPPPVSTLATLVDQGDLGALKTGINSIWSDLLKHHQRSKAYIPNTVTHMFQQIQVELRKL